MAHGALPICGEDDRLKRMVTDRDIVVRCHAEGGAEEAALDPQDVGRVLQEVSDDRGVTPRSCSGHGRNRTFCMPSPLRWNVAYASGASSSVR
jgi:hypothetical protein